MNDYSRALPRQPVTVDFGPAEEAQPGPWMQVMLILLLILPVWGTFTPPESYFGTWGAENQVEILPYPITPVMLVLETIACVYMYLQIRARGKFVHEPLAYAFLAVVFGSIVLSADMQYSFQRALRLLPLIALGIIFAQLYTLPRMLKLMTIAVLISALLSILVSVAFPSLGRSANMVGEYGNAWRGATSHKNSAGYTYALGVIVSFFAGVAGGVSWRLLIPTVLSCLLMVVMANSATALVGMVATLGFAGAILLMKRMPARVAPLFMVMALALGGAGAMVLAAAPRLSQVVTGRDASMTGRTDIWDAVEMKIAERPITGHGYAFWSVDSPDRNDIWNTVAYTPPHSHNSWLDLLLQLGIIGMGIILLLVISTLFRSIYRLINTGSLSATLALSILFFVLSRSFTEVQFSEPGTGGVFWLVWAATLSRQKSVEQQ